MVVMVLVALVVVYVIFLICILFLLLLASSRFSVVAAFWLVLFISMLHSKAFVHFIVVVVTFL